MVRHFVEQFTYVGLFLVLFGAELRLPIARGRQSVKGARARGA